MTGKLMFVPDTHVVVPKDKPTDEMAEAFWEAPGDKSVAFRYRRMMAKAPQLTTPPVLRWEGDTLKCGNMQMAHAWEFNGQFWHLVTDRHRSPLQTRSLKEARRAAEKALGLPEIEEV